MENLGGEIAGAGLANSSFRFFFSGGGLNTALLGYFRFLALKASLHKGDDGKGAVAPYFGQLISPAFDNGRGLTMPRGRME